MTSKLQKQIFRKIKAKKVRLKHFCLPTPYFLSDFQNFFFYSLIFDRCILYQKNSLLAPSGAEIIGGVGRNPHTTANGLVWKGLILVSFGVLNENFATLAYHFMNDDKYPPIPPPPRIPHENFIFSVVRFHLFDSACLDYVFILKIL